MAVSTTDTYSGPYTANGVTVAFPFTFKAVAVEDVAVFIRDEDGNDSLIDESAYSVTLASEGGTATFETAPASGDVYVVSEPSFLQSVIFASGQAFLPSVVNEVNDRDVVRALYLKREIDRAPKIPIGGGQDGKFPVVVPGGWGFASGTGADSALRQDIADPAGASLVGFDQLANYLAGSVGRALRDQAVSVTDAPFLADRTGVANSSPAFAAAIAASNVIVVPAGTYRLDTTPIWVNKEWRISPAAVFTGAGTGVGKFPYMNTNAAQLAVGPFIQAYSYLKSAHPNGGTAAFNVEMIQPDDYGAGQQVAMFLGNRSNAAHASANTWGLNIVTGVLSGALGTHQGIEVDIDTNSASATTKGIAITGGGTANADVAIEIDRAQMKWDIGISMSKANDAIVVTGVAGGRGLTLHSPTAFVEGVAGAAISARQFVNANDTIFLQRLTDTAPTGNFFRAVNAANNVNLALLDVSGNMALFGTMQAALLLAIYSNNAGIDALTLKNSSSASVTSKYVNATFKGADTTSAEKTVGGLRFDPVDVNWVDALLTINTRQSDTVVIAARLMGTGSPEGVVTAPPGAIYTRKDGGATTTLYVKTSGTGNTGWTAK